MPLKLTETGWKVHHREVQNYSSLDVHYFAYQTQKSWDTYTVIKIENIFEKNILQ